MVDKLLIAERNRTRAEKEARRKAMEARENAHKAELLRKYRFRQMMAKGEVAKFMKTRRLPKKRS